jgi:peptidoglycan hydrolase-like protein with peptidoglycan-binding domain
MASAIKFDMRLAMRKMIGKLLIGTASVLALTIGTVAHDYAAAAGNTVTAATAPSTAMTSDDALTADVLRRNDIRWAQVELRYRGFYYGSLDGVLGAATRHAIVEFQQSRGLDRTAALDAQTWDALTSGDTVNYFGSEPSRRTSSISI